MMVRHKELAALHAAIRIPTVLREWVASALSSGSGAAGSGVLRVAASHGLRSDEIARTAVGRRAASTARLGRAHPIRQREYRASYARGRRHPGWSPGPPNP